MDRAVAHYLEQRAVDAALGFIDALEKAYGHIEAITPACARDNFAPS